MKFFVVIVLFVSSFSAQSQSLNNSSFIKNKVGNIKGIVFDNENTDIPLAFAKVSVKNTAITTTTNTDGVYKLQLKPGVYTLIYTFIGYKTIEVKNITVLSSDTTIQNQTLCVLTPSFKLLTDTSK